MRALLVLCLVLSSGLAAAADRPIRGRGTPYLVEAARLTAAGWKPVALAGAAGCPDRSRACADRPETRWCEPGPAGGCGYTWTRDDRIIEVIAAGAMPPRVVSTRCLNGDRCRSGEIGGPTPGTGIRLF